MSAIWQPTWLANTAYTVPAVVIPTVFAGFTWRCTTAGTSGGTEPSWPTDVNLNPTVNDGTVVWSVGTGFRQSVQNGLAGIVQTFATANPTIIRSVRTVRPPSFAGSTSLPVFFVGDMNESIVHDQGKRSRTFTGLSGYLVDQLGTIDDSNNRMNFAADVLIDWFTLNYHAATTDSIFQHTGTNDFEFEEGTVRYPALEFLFAATEKLEGRT